jgi:putative ABC transport system substrate-binding protein
VQSKRRRLLVLAAALAAARPVVAERKFRIGILDPGDAPEAERDVYWGEMLQRLKELGYERGRNLVVDMSRGDGKPARLQGLARTLAEKNPDVIVVSTTPGVRTVMAVTATIPIVFPTAGNPVEAGLVQSLARPGGNVTGQSIIGTDTAAKRIELLLELVPNAKRLAFIGPGSNRSVAAVLRALEQAARTRSLEFRHLDATNEAASIERAFARLPTAPVDALIVSAILAGRRRELAALAERHRLPAIYAYQEHLDAGGLVAFGPDLRLAYRRTADYVHRILQGASPADMPVEQVRFSVGVNLKAARAIGITVPRSFLLRADRIIE